MEMFKAAFAAVLDILRLEVTVGGFTFSFFGLFAFTVAGGIVGVVLRALFGD